MGSGTESQVVEGLVRSAAAGDRTAQDVLLERYWPMIERVVRARRSRMGRSLKLREDTDDLVQEVAIELLRSLPNQQWQGAAAFGAWVKRLAEYQVIDAQRYHGRKKRDRGAETSANKSRVELAAVARSVESQFDDRRRAEALALKIADLKDEYAAALIMNYQGFTHGQIGEALGCTAEAARKLVSRARAKLT